LRRIGYESWVARFGKIEACFLVSTKVTPSISILFDL